MERGLGQLDRKQFRSLVAFVKTLPKPVEATPTNPSEQAAAERGKELFRTVGCAVCHVPDLGITFSGALEDGHIVGITTEPAPKAQIRLTASSDDLVAMHAKLLGQM